MRSDVSWLEPLFVERSLRQVHELAVSVMYNAFGATVECLNRYAGYALRRAQGEPLAMEFNRFTVGLSEVGSVECGMRKGNGQAPSPWPSPSGRGDRRRRQVSYRPSGRTIRMSDSGAVESSENPGVFQWTGALVDSFLALTCR